MIKYCSEYWMDEGVVHNASGNVGAVLNIRLASQVTLNNCPNPVSVVITRTLKT